MKVLPSQIDRQANEDKLLKNISLASTWITIPFPNVLDLVRTCLQSTVLM